MSASVGVMQIVFAPLGRALMWLMGITEAAIVRKRDEPKTEATPGSPEQTAPQAAKAEPNGPDDDDDA
jgi:hypothetical protein